MVKVEFECLENKVEHVLGIVVCVLGCQRSNITVSRGMNNYCAIYMGAFNGITLRILNIELKKVYVQGLVSYYSIGHI